MVTVMVKKKQARVFSNQLRSPLLPCRHRILLVTTFAELLLSFDIIIELKFLCRSNSSLNFSAFHTPSLPKYLLNYIQFV